MTTLEILTSVLIAFSLVAFLTLYKRSERKLKAAKDAEEQFRKEREREKMIETSQSGPFIVAFDNGEEVIYKTTFDPEYHERRFAALTHVVTGSTREGNTCIGIQAGFDPEKYYRHLAQIEKERLFQRRRKARRVIREARPKGSILKPNKRSK